MNFGRAESRGGGGEGVEENGGVEKKKNKAGREEGNRWRALRL